MEKTMPEDVQPVSHLDVMRHWPEALRAILEDMPNRDDTALGDFAVGLDGTLWNTFEDGCPPSFWIGQDWGWLAEGSWVDEEEEG